MKNYTKQTFKIFLKHCRDYKFSIFVIIIFVILASAMGRLTPLFYKNFFNLLEAQAEIKFLIDILIQILIINGLGWLSWRISTFFMISFQSRVMTNLTNTCFAYLHKHAINFFNNNFVGSLVKRVNRFSRAFEVISDVFIWELLPIVVDMGFIITVLFFQNTSFGFIVLGWTIIYIVISYIFNIWKLKYDIQKSALNSKVTGVLADTITNHSNIKLFTNHQKEKNNFQKVTNQLRKITKFTWNLSEVFTSIQGFLMISLEFIMLYFALQLWYKDNFTIGDLVLVQTYLVTIFHKLWGFGRIIRRYYESMADAEEMTEILETPHEIQDVRNAQKLKVNQGKIEFKDVIFSYHQTRRIFNKLNLKINPQEKIALVGPSGSGKTSFVNILLRNYDIEKGKILIDDQKTSRVTQESIWGNISLVPQDPILFHRTLMENIRYGNLQASDQEVFKASKLAHCDVFIDQLSEKYQTYVGERGVKLSGGERQRVAIARAIIKNSPILILDEATSSLDSQSEELIQDALNTLMKDKTVIVIAHRLSTIMKMDRILVFEDGKIIEQGTHQELIQDKFGLYKKLWEKQICSFT
jgi:ATP-binding cassette, subfamily B, bacterial